MFKNDRKLYELHVKYFTKKYANIKSFEDFKPYDKWDFSVDPKSLKEEIKFNDNEKIKLYFNINGSIKKYCIDCYLSSNIGEVIEKIQEMMNMKFNYDIIFLYDGRRLKSYSTLGENGLKNESNVTIIHDVHY